MTNQKKGPVGTAIPPSRGPNQSHTGFQNMNSKDNTLDFGDLESPIYDLRMLSLVATSQVESFAAYVHMRGAEQGVEHPEISISLQEVERIHWTVGDLMCRIKDVYDQYHRLLTPETRLPRGRYLASIVHSEISTIDEEDPKAGRCLRLSWQIESGQYAGARIEQRLDLWAAAGEKVANQANMQFSLIRQATGKLAPQDSTELHHIPCVITVKSADYDGGPAVITKVCRQLS